MTNKEVQRTKQEESSFPHYSIDQLKVFDALQKPVWVFDIAEKRMHWANPAALIIWKADSLQELLARDFKTDMSEATEWRLQDHLSRFGRGGVMKEQWQIYPNNGLSKSIQVTTSAIRIEDTNDGGHGGGGRSHIAALAEAESPDIENFEDSSVRGIELLRHLPMAVCQFDIHGKLIYQNPKAVSWFGLPMHPLDSDNSDNPAGEDNTGNGDGKEELTQEEEERKNTPPPTKKNVIEEGKNQDDGDPTEDDDRHDQTKPLSEYQYHKDQEQFLSRFVDRQMGKSMLHQVQQGRDCNVEAEHYTQSESGSGWFSVAMKQAKDPVTSDPMIIYSAKDIQEITQARKDTTQANDKSEFMAVMAHEIRTPLHQIIGCMDLLQATANKAGNSLSREQTEYVDIVQASANTLMTIINDLLDYKKLESNSVQLEPVAFDCMDVLTGTVAANEDRAHTKNLKLQVQWNKIVPTKLIGDPNRLRQILLQLISNAIKFTERGSILLKADVVEYNETKTSAKFRFSITDTGIGIDPTHQTHLFQKYQQANASIARNYGGIGVGLCICKSLTELMGGTIELTSAIRKGTTVQVELPFEIQSNQTFKRSTSRLPAFLPVQEKRALQILLVEDNKVNQKVVTRMLQRIGHSVTIAANGQLALDELERHDHDSYDDKGGGGSGFYFDMVLMDVQMPVMDGIEATKRIRQWKSQPQANANSKHKIESLPIVGLTASFQPSELDFYEGIGMNMCLGKPVKLNHLKTAIACVCDYEEG